LARSITALIVLLVLPAACHAGFCSAKPTADFLRHEFRFSAGYSPQSSTLIGTTEGRRFVMAEVDYNYTCWTWYRVAIGLTPGIMPAAILLQPAGFTAGHAVYGFECNECEFSIRFWRRFGLAARSTAFGAVRIQVSACFECWEDGRQSGRR